MDNEDKVVRCFNCQQWVREPATSTVPTGERGDPERWCFGCIEDVDIYTASIDSAVTDNKVEEENSSDEFHDPFEI